MPDADIATAIDMAERLRTGIASLDDPEASADQGAVTVSVGVAAAVPEAGRGWNHLVRQADAELYRAKRAGRNRVRPTGSG
jgi:diguanylate cyclase (GGDEF)-like protein